MPIDLESANTSQVPAATSQAPNNHSKKIALQKKEIRLIESFPPLYATITRVNHFSFRSWSGSAGSANDPIILSDSTDEEGPSDPKVSTSGGKEKVGPMEQRVISPKTAVNKSGNQHGATQPRNPYFYLGKNVSITMGPYKASVGIVQVSFWQNLLF